MNFGCGMTMNYWKKLLRKKIYIWPNLMISMVSGNSHLPNLSIFIYSRVHISSDEVFSKILRKPSIVQKKIIPHMKAKVVFIGKKRKRKKKNSKKKFKMADLKKSSFSSSANSQYFFTKISWIGPWVSRIDWCEGHWCGLTYMVVRLSNVSSKTA